MEDLREKTHTQHYERYRQKRLQEMGFTDMSADNRPVRYGNGSLSSMCHDYLYDHSVQETYEHKRQDHLREMQGKEEQMRQMFVQKVYLPH